jgi:putative intracellular protease/amidase
MANADNDVTSVEKDFVKKIVNAGKPIAAQTGAIWILAKAGVLNGKKFAFRFDATGHPDFENAIYGGRGVVQDGIIITSGTCPMIAKNTGNPDGTAKLTQTLIDAIKVKLNKHHSNK